MKREEQEKYHRRLLEMAARLKGDEAGVTNDALRQSSGDHSGNLSNIPMHLADLASDAFEQEMSASLMTNARQLQVEVAGALDRFEQGTFGSCQQCGRDISDARMHALPYTRYCVDCAQNAESEGEVGFRPTLL